MSAGIDPDSMISTLAFRQNGIVTTSQLLQSGITYEQIRSRVRRGWLHRIYRGVYAVGYPPVTREARFQAAVLSCGPESLLSHRSAAELWELLPRIAGPIHVTTHRGRTLRGRGPVITHRSRRAHREEFRMRRGVPVTSPTRTLLDLARSEPTQVEAALDEALIRRLTSRKELVRVAPLHFGDRGLGVLGELIRKQDGSFSRKEGERKLRKLINAAELPEPQRNTVVHGHELDLYWPALRFNVEMDGYRWHSTRSRLNRDRERDAHLAAQGIRVLRISYDQLREPAKLIANLTATIANLESDREMRSRADQSNLGSRPNPPGSVIVGALEGPSGR